MIHFSGEPLHNYLELSSGYQVDGLLAAGSLDSYTHTKCLPNLRAAIRSLGVEAEVQKINRPRVGQNAYELAVDGRIYWFVVALGSAQMARYTHIASALGSKVNLLVGVVGGLDKRTSPGDFILPTVSRGNATSAMYQRITEDSIFYPDLGLTKKLKERLPDGTSFLEGPTVTCEAIFAQTSEDVQKWSDDGFLGVEMEAATLFAVSRHFDVPAAALLYVSDNLAAGITLVDDMHYQTADIRAKSRKLQYEAGLAELLNL